MFAAKPANLNLNSEKHMVVKTELTLANCPLNSIHAVCGTHIHTQINGTMKETWGRGTGTFLEPCTQEAVSGDL